MKGVLIAGAAIAAIAAIAAGAANARPGPQHPTLLTGVEWKAYGSTEKQAYLNGFLAGAAAEQAALAAPPVSAAHDSAATSSRVIAELMAGKKLHFPYAPSVYSAQLDDYFWYTDHVATPIVDVMASVNRRMLDP